MAPDMPKQVFPEGLRSRRRRKKKNKVGRQLNLGEGCRASPVPPEAAPVSALGRLKVYVPQREGERVRDFAGPAPGRFPRLESLPAKKRRKGG